MRNIVVARSNLSLDSCINPGAVTIIIKGAHTTPIKVTMANTKVNKPAT